MFVFSKIAALLFYPLGLTLIVGTTGLSLLIVGRRFGLHLVALALSGLYVCSIPLTSTWLVHTLERRYDPQAEYPEASAVVLLGGGEVPPVAPRIYAEVGEGGDRILHAARLYRQGLAPWVVTTGGRYPLMYGDYEGTAASVNAEILAAELQLPRTAILLEEKSRNTYEHAPNVKKILSGKGLSLEVILVTSAMHMHRSVKVFEKQGFTVHPAPTDYFPGSKFDFGFTSFLPNVGSLSGTTKALHEYYGLVAYTILRRI